MANFMRDRLAEIQRFKEIMDDTPFIWTGINETVSKKEEARRLEANNKAFKVINKYYIALQQFKIDYPDYEDNNE